VQAEIITIGDEILIGQIVDTNSAWMGRELNKIGLRVKQISSVSDDPQHIRAALDEARGRADIILITGGLGPTNDDLTKNTLKDYFGMDWRMDEQVLEDVTGFFARFGRETTEVNRLQAQVPAGCVALRNRFGTAPGMWFEIGGKVFVSMPGVPHEMKGLMESEVLPRLKEKFKLPFICHSTILTQGIGESVLAEKIADWEKSLEALGIKLAYLPSPGMVRLRLSCAGEEKKVRGEVDEKVKELQQLIPEFIFGYGEETLPEVIGRLLMEKKQTLSTAESCTGGYAAHLITSVAGSSAYFLGSIIAYANEVKMQQLGVQKSTIEKYGAVSEEVAREMAEGVRQKLGTDYGLAFTGIAGPGGGSEEKPVGTVWIAVASAKGAVSKKFQFGDNRERNIQRAAVSGLGMLRKELIR